MADEYLDCMHHLNSVVSMANGFTRQQEARVKWERCAEMRGKTILLAAIWVRIGKCGGKVNVPHTWTDKLNACFESKPVSGRKCFGFCICVCRCASHVSSGYEPQFVFSDACFLRVLWSRCVFLMSLMLFQSGKSYASESYAASQSSVCGSYGILRRLAMTDSLVARVSDIQSRSPQAPCCHTAICR